MKQKLRPGCGQNHQQWIVVGDRMGRKSQTPSRPSVSVQSLSRVQFFVTPWTIQHTRPPCPLPTPRVYSNSCPLSRWHHPTISSSVIPFSSLPSIFASIRVFSYESVLHVMWPKYWSFSFSTSLSNEYSGLISLGWTGWISLLSKGLLGVLSNTTVQKHSLFGT